MTRMCQLDGIDHALNKLSTKKIAIELGTYYAGWTKYLAEKFDYVISFQTPKKHKLNNVGSEEGEFSEEGLRWKEIMREKLPPEHQTYYSFDYLAELIEPHDNVLQLLHHSPPTVPFNYTFDLWTYDISRDPAEQLKQYKFWRNYGKPGSVMLMGIYHPQSYDNFEMTPQEFLDQINEKWEYVPNNKRYICIYL